MKKILIVLLLITVALVGCEQPQYEKVEAQIIDKEIGQGRYGEWYELDIAYTVDSGSFIIDDFEVDKSEFDEYEINEKVTAYINSNNYNIKEIIKEGEKR